MIIQGIRSNKFLPRAIQFWMFIYFIRVNTWRLVTFQPLLPRLRVPNHFSVINNLDEYEAVAEGVVKGEYNITGHQYVKHWEVPNTIDIGFLLDKTVHKGYEYINFLTNMVYALTGIWVGDFVNRWYCVELVNFALIMNGDTNVKKRWNPYQTAYYLDNKYGGTVVKDNEKLTIKKTNL